MINDLWYKNAIIYCLDVATFADSNGDGVGDFRGLSEKLPYLAGIGVSHVPLASNSVSVQLNWLRHGAGVGIVHDFALPSAPELRKIMTDQISLTRAFWLIRHADDGRIGRLNRFAAVLVAEFRDEMQRLEVGAR